MKRSTKPMKRTELKRGKPLARSTKPMARTSTLKTTSTPKARRPRPEERERHDKVRAAVFERDGHTCQLAGVEGAGACFGHLTPHHRLKAGQGATYTLRNLVALCAHHNDELEANADLAAIGRERRLVITKREALIERFEAKLEEGPLPEWDPTLGPCLLWTGTKTKEGYGKFQVRKGEFVYAHRFAVSLTEELVAGYEVDHLCRVRGCCRREHLEQVTPEENRRRQALAKPEQTKCGRGHRLEGRQSNGAKLCLVCRAASREAYRTRKATKENTDARLTAAGEDPAGQGPTHEEEGEARTHARRGGTASGSGAGPGEAPARDRRRQRVRGDAR